MQWFQDLQLGAPLPHVLPLLHAPVRVCGTALPVCRCLAQVGMTGTRPSQRAAHVGHTRHGARASRTHEHVGIRCARSRRLENAVCLAGDRDRLRLERALPGWLGATGEGWTRAVFPYQPARALRIRSPLAWAVTVFGGVPLWAQDENCEISTK